MKAGNVYTAYRTDKEREEYRARQQEEVDANYGAFKKMLPRLLKEHSGEYVLMRKGHIGNFSWFSSAHKRRDNLARYYATDRKMNNGLVAAGLRQ